MQQNITFCQEGIHLWSTSDTDKERNPDQYEAAVAQYLGGNDDRWSRVWWDVAPNE